MLKTIIAICLGSLIGQAIGHEDGYALFMSASAVILLAADAYIEAKRRHRA